MAELVYAFALEASSRKRVGVQVPLSAYYGGGYKMKTCVQKKMHLTTEHYIKVDI